MWSAALPALIGPILTPSTTEKVGPPLNALLISLTWSDGSVENEGPAARTSDQDGPDTKMGLV